MIIKVTSKPLFPSKGRNLILFIKSNTCRCPPLMINFFFSSIDVLSLIKIIFGNLGLPDKQFIKSIKSDLFRGLIYSELSN